MKAEFKIGDRVKILSYSHGSPPEMKNTVGEIGRIVSLHDFAGAYVNDCGHASLAKVLLDKPDINGKYGAGWYYQLGKDFEHYEEPKITEEELNELMI